MALLHALLEFFSVTDNTGFNHFSQQVVAFTCTFSYTGKHREAVLLLRNIVNELLDKHRLAYTGATKQTDFTALAIWFQQVDNLDACIKHLLYGSQIFKLRGVAMDGISTCTVQLLHAVDRVAHYVHQAAFDLCTYRHGDGASQRMHFHTSLQAVRTVHSNSTHRVFTNVLLYLYNQSFAVRPFYFQCVVNTRQHHFCLRSFEIDVYYRPDYL